MKIRLPNRQKAAAPRPKRRPVPARKAPAKIKLNAAVARRAPRLADDEDDYYDEQEPNMKLSHAFVVVLVLHVIAVAGVFAFNTIKTRQSPVFSEETADKSGNFAAAPAPKTDPVEDSSAASRTFEPRGLTEAPTEQQSASQKATAEFTGQTHEMRPGDTLTRISSLYGVSIAAIQTENDIVDPTKIRVGEILRIPSADAPVQVAQTTAPATAVEEPAPVVQTESAPAVAQEAPPAPATASDTYEVVSGDNPWSIAKKLNVSYQKLIEVNEIEDATKIQIGQKLKIPASN